MNETELIKEATRRGYTTGTIIDYESRFSGTDTLGSGEFCVKNGKLIKYEKPLKHDNPNARRFDVIWSEASGWTKIAEVAHGFAL